MGVVPMEVGGNNQKSQWNARRGRGKKREREREREREMRREEEMEMKTGLVRMESNGVTVEHVRKGGRRR